MVDKKLAATQGRKMREDIVSHGVVDQQDVALGYPQIFERLDLPG